MEADRQTLARTTMQNHPSIPTSTSLSRRTLLRTAFGAGAFGLLGRWSRLGAESARPAPTPPATPFPNFEREPVTSEQLAPNFWMLSGPGGNMGLLETEQGALLVDSGIRPRAQETLRGATALTRQPIRWVANTHWHFDHVGGNALLAEQGATVIAHEAVRQRMSVETYVEMMQRSIPAAPLGARPALTFRDRLELAGAAEIVHLPPSHTDGDAYVFAPAKNVLVTGDLFWNGGYPLIDFSTGGSVDGMIAANRVMLERTDARTRIIPGHGPAGDRQDLQDYVEMLERVRDAVRPLFDAGKSLEETIAAKPTKAIDDRWGKRFRDGDFIVRGVYGGFGAARR